MEIEEVDVTFFKVTGKIKRFNGKSPFMEHSAKENCKLEDM